MGREIQFHYVYCRRILMSVVNVLLLNHIQKQTECEVNVKKPIKSNYYPLHHIKWLGYIFRAVGKTYPVISTFNSLFCGNLNLFVKPLSPWATRDSEAYLVLQFYLNPSRGL